MHPLSNSDLAASRSIVSHLLSLDLLSLISRQKDAFYVALAVLVYASQVSKSKVFISEALAQTSYIFHSLDHALKSNMEISSKLDALKRKKIEFELTLLAKKQAT